MAKEIGSALDHVQLAANPAAPGANRLRVYARSDGRLYTEDSTGLVAAASDPLQREPVRVATTGNITLSGTQTIDGVAVVVGDRVLARVQTAQADNGIYVVAASTWARAADANAAAEVQRGTRVQVLQGTTWMLHEFTQLNAVATIGTDAQQWRVYTTVDQSSSLLPPTPIGAGHMMFNQTQHTMQVWDGTAWVLLNSLAVCTSSTRPSLTGLSDGMWIFETDTGYSYILQSGVWQPIYGPHTHGVTDLTATGVKDGTTFLRSDNTWAVPDAGGGVGTTTPPGCVQMYVAATAPTGWLVCDGSLVDRSTYAALFAVIGFTYSPTVGSDPGGNKFYLPDMAVRFPMGAGSSVNLLGVSDTTPGGESDRNDRMQHTHSHAVGGLTPTGTSGSTHTHGIAGQAADPSPISGGSGAGFAPRATQFTGHAHGGDTTTTGSSHTHNITGSTASKGTGTTSNWAVHAFQTFTFIIKY